MKVLVEFFGAFKSVFRVSNRSAAMRRLPIAAHQSIGGHVRERDNWIQDPPTFVSDAR